MRICLALALASLRDLQVQDACCIFSIRLAYCGCIKVASRQAANQPKLQEYQREIANAGRKRSRRTMQPRDTKELEVDVTDAMYSSSQQINGQQKPGMF